MNPDEERWSSRSQAAIAARTRKTVSTSPVETAARWLVMGPIIVFLLLMVVIPPIWVMSSPLKPGAGFVGRYAFVGPGSDEKRVFIDLNVSRGKDGKLAVGFSGGHGDGSGAAPDGGGSGTVGSDGVLNFDYEDSFANKGMGTLQRTKNGEFRMIIDIKDVQDARCLGFYGEHILKRSRDAR